jgi:surface protein
MTSNTIKISQLNLSGMSSELINILREDFPEDNVIHEFDYSPELIRDFNQRNVTKENYKQLIDMYQFLLIDNDNCKKLAIEIAKLDLKNKHPMFRHFYNNFVNNTFHSKEELKNAIQLYCKNKENCEEKYGFVELWDVSNMTNMNGMFSYGRFTGDISQWDVSGVTNMSEMFTCSEFNGDISQWDVSNVTNMSGMFYNSQFHGNISQWDVSNVTNMRCMFYNSQFHSDISQWDVSNVTNMSCMFECSKFNGDISHWNISNVTDMSSMFECSKFNGDISQWDVSNVTDMSSMFECSKFNGDISNWVKKPY